MAMRCHWMGARRVRTGFTDATTVLMNTYLAAGEPVQLVGRGAVAAEHVAAAAKLIAVQPRADAFGQRSDEVCGAGEIECGVDGIGTVHLGDEPYAYIALDGRTEL